MNSPSPYRTFKYYWPDQVPAIGGASCSVARTIFSSSESVREAMSVLASLEEAHIMLQEDALALPLDFLQVTLVHYWLWIMSE